ncbi:MAG: tRNA (guanosine(46)-N7)-methyltransferase TrmB [Lachnospiraceae bacterium]|nr:tRNA (guanosine(46)-N7)-methyltransferase TrmB [Lachnospiraceae bacterium]
MRLRNIPKADSVIAESPFCVQNAMERKGQWKLSFDNDNPIFIEIGVGKGQFILEQARLHPEVNFVGIEMYTSVLCRAVEKLEAMEHPPKNLLLLREDARLLSDIFAKGEVERIYLNFSDPWPKARHAKCRLTSPRFLKRYEEVLAEGGRIEFKTDNRELFDFSLESFDEAPRWETDAVTFDLHRDDAMREGNIMTEYEEKFASEGKPIHKLIAHLMCLALLVTMLFPPVPAEAANVWPSGVDTESASVVVMEEESGAVLYQKHPNHEYYPASITKIMTALLAIESCDLDEVVKFSSDAVYLNEGDTSHIAREVGEKMTMEQCLYGMLLESANECAWAIAEHVGGSEKAFVKMMNKRAKEIGCKHTHFGNPNGLPQDDHYTSSYDMALISREAFHNKTFRTIVGTRAYTIPPTNKHSEPTLLNNHHAMLNYYRTNKYLYEGCLGGKTGYTVVAQNTLVTYAKRNGMTLVCVVMNAPSPGYYTDTIRLFDYYFDNFVTYPVAETGGLSSAAKRSTGRMAETVELFSVDEDATVVLPKTASVLDTEVSLEPLQDNGDGVVGELSFSYGDHYVGGGKLRFASADGYSYPFHNLEKETEGFFRVDFAMIGAAVAGLCGLIGVILLLRWLSPLVYQKRMRRRDERKARKPKYQLIRNNGRRKRRRRR